MRLLLAGSVFQSHWPGGEPLAAATVAAGLRATGHEVRVAALERRGLALGAMAASPFDSDPMAVRRYAELLREYRPEVVFGFFDFDSSLCLACHLNRVPYIGCIHIFWPSCPIGTLYLEGQGLCPGASAGRCLRHMVRQTPPVRLGPFTDRLPPVVAGAVYAKFRTRRAVLSKAAMFIVPSENSRSHLEAAGFGPVRVVPNGIELGSLPPVPWAGGEKLILFTAGKRDERKGFEHFRQLAQRLRPEFPEARFVATNCPDEGPVEGTPFLSRLEFCNLLAKAYAVVTPVLWDEPFGYVAVEAMAASKPVVAYASGALPEIVSDQESGLTVPRGDVGRLAAAVRALLLDEKRAVEYGGAGRKRAESRYSSSRMVAGYLEAARAALPA